MSFRTTLLLGAAFLAGVAISPASDLIAKHLVRGLGVNAAYPGHRPGLPTFHPVWRCIRAGAQRACRSSLRQELMENALNGMLTGSIHTPAT